LAFIVPWGGEEMDSKQLEAKVNAICDDVEAMLKDATIEQAKILNRLGMEISRVSTDKIYSNILGSEE
jgi:hypothetical protein